MDTPSLDPSLIAAVKGFEGFMPKAQWDYKQHSNGYGTRASSAGEVIDQPTADARLTSELGRAQAQVDGFAPNLPPGPRKALASLTFNAGPGWMGSGLGSAVKSGDWDKAQNLFLQYNKAGGQENPGLTARRQQEAQWFGQPAQQPAAPFQAIPPGTAPNLPLFGQPTPAAQAPAAGPGAPSAPGNPGSSPLVSFFASLPAAPQPGPLPMFPQQQRPNVDTSQLQAFLQNFKQQSGAI